jgi:hypothetical protein
MMKTLSRLRKLASTAQHKLERGIIGMLDAGARRESDLLIKLDSSPVPDSLPAGVVIRSVLGDPADRGIRELWQADDVRPSYEMVGA